MLRKKTLIENIQKKGKLKSAKEAKAIYDLVMGCIQEGLLNEEDVKIPGVGILKIKTKAKRRVTVPGIEEKVIVDARKGVSFKEDDDIKARLNKEE